MKPGITFGDEAKAGIARRHSPPVLFLPPLDKGVADGPCGRGKRIRGAGECGMAKVEADGGSEWLGARRLKLDQPPEFGQRHIGIGDLFDDARVVCCHGMPSGTLVTEF